MARSTAPLQAPRLFFPEQRLEVAFPIQAVQIDWERLTPKRPMVLAALDEMPVYLLMPEVLSLLAAEKHATYRLILDLMWSTGARSPRRCWR